MEDSIRRSMTVLHTWVGVVIGSLLFVIFWTGTITVFDREIDRWMMPSTRLPASSRPYSLDAALDAAASASLASAPSWYIRLPTSREPTVELRYPLNGRTVARHVDPYGLRVLRHSDTWGASGFIYPLHVSLHLGWVNLGRWLVGVAGTAMLVLLASGVVIHRRMMADFFVVRPSQRRLHLRDLHTLVGVVALPFHLVITASGLAIFGATYFPMARMAVYGANQGDALSAVPGAFARRASGTTASLTSLDAVVTKAQEVVGSPPFVLVVRHPGDANAYVRVSTHDPDGVVRRGDDILFDGVTGTVLQPGAPPSMVLSLRHFIAGLHLALFDRWILRWLYFLGGVSSCVMIATGLLYWLDTRRTKHATQGQKGVRIVEGLAVGSVAGIVLATLAFFIANRLLPAGAHLAGYDRPVLEAWAFCLTWIATFAHAWLRPRAAWQEQAWAIAVSAFVAVVLNWITTGDHPLISIRKELWAVLGMDGVMLVSAAVAALAAWRLGRPAPVSIPSRSLTGMPAATAAARRR